MTQDTPALQLGLEQATDLVYELAEASTILAVLQEAAQHIEPDDVKEIASKASDKIGTALVLTGLDPEQIKGVFDDVRSSMLSGPDAE